MSKYSRRISRLWGDLPLRAKGLAIVAVPLLALLATAAVFFWAGRLREDLNRSLVHVYAVRERGAEVRRLVNDAESGVRLYLLLGRQDALEPYDHARQALPEALATMEALTAEHPDERAILLRVGEQMAQRLGQLASLRQRAGLPTSSRLEDDLLIQGTAVRNTIRQELSAVEQAEYGALAARVARVQRLNRPINTIILLGALPGIVGLLCVWMFTSDVVARVHRMEDHAERLSCGLPLSIVPAKDDEIGRLEQKLAGASGILSQREHQLSDVRAFLEHLITTSPVVIFRRGAGDLVLTYLSPNVERLLGYGMPQLLGVPDAWDEHVHPEDRPHVLAELNNAVDRRATQLEQDYRFLHGDGEYRWLNTLARLEYDDRAEFTGLLGYAIDITASKQAEVNVRQAREEADRASRAKSEFLSRMSHELRTPMNAVLGFAQLLEMDTVVPEHRASVNHILSAGQHLLNLINEVLDITRIEAGRLGISPEPVSLREVFGEVVDLVKPMAQSRDTVIASDSTSADHYVMADRQRLKQVLLNLLSNAVKYGRKAGMVTLSSVITADGDLRISVRDDGPGIAPEKLPRLFSPFDRLGEETSEIEGTGLGLSLSKALVEAMGGRVGVESTVGRGSTFWIELSLVQRSGEQERGDEGLSAVGRRAAADLKTILYIEDNLSNLRLLEGILARLPQVRLLAASQGQLGIDLAREHRPDLILLDQHLPDLNGSEVLRRLREDSRTKDTPVVIVTADASPGQSARFLAAGAQQYLTKPFNVKHLLQTLDEVLAM